MVAGVSDRSVSWRSKKRGKACAMKTLMSYKLWLRVSKVKAGREYSREGVSPFETGVLSIWLG